MAGVRPAVESLDWQSSDLPRAGQNARPLAIAHRGDPIAHRENTVAAIRSALDCGADIVEIDVKTTEDGVSVVLHDDSLRRLWGVDRDIRTMSAAEVTGIGIPTLRAVLALFEGRRAAVMVDMDSGEWARAARVEAGSAVSTGRLRQEQVMWCGHVAGMREVRQHDPDARVFLSWGEEALDGPPADDLLTEEPDRRPSTRTGRSSSPEGGTGPRSATCPSPVGRSTTRPSSPGSSTGEWMR